MSRIELEQHEAIMRLTAEMRTADINIEEKSFYEPKVEVLEESSLEYQEWLALFEEDQVQFELCK